MRNSIQPNFKPFNSDSIFLSNARKLKLNEKLQSWRVVFMAMREIFDSKEVSLLGGSGGVLFQKNLKNSSSLDVFSFILSRNIML